MFAYNEIHGFNEEIANLLAEDYVNTIPELFSSEHDSDTIKAALPPAYHAMFAPDFLTVLRSGDFHPVKAALVNNDVYRWIPVSPTRRHLCMDEVNVPYANATVALGYFTTVDAEVELETLHFSSHSDCAAPALINGISWFDSLAILP